MFSCEVLAGSMLWILRCEEDSTTGSIATLSENLLTLINKHNAL